MSDTKRAKIEKLSSHHIERYSRQLLIDNIGVEGQLKLLNSSVLLIGAGGLASSAAMYLAGSGVGRIGIVDYDVVEESNLHRQIIHDESSIDVAKVESAKRAILRFNSSIDVVAHNVAFNSRNAMEIVQDYDIVLDCSDNVATRYLINDACVLSGKTLVSGSSIRMEGQLTVYNYMDGPCYRCLFPVPPPPETVGNCSDNGVLGVVPGIIGSLQCLEATKIITGNGDVLSQKLLLFDAMRTTFRVVKLRKRNPNCVVCGENPTVTELIDYEEFCGVPASDQDVEVVNILSEDQNVTCAYYDNIRKEENHVLLDVRTYREIGICTLENFVHIPLDELDARWEEVKDLIDSSEQDISVYCLCRRGRRSQEAVKILQEKGIMCKNIVGGLKSWKEEVDPSFPKY